MTDRTASDSPPIPTGAIAALRWSLVFVFVFFGIAKFAAYEAEAVAGLAGHHPLFAWMFGLWGPRVASGVIGTIELVTALFLALGAWSARAGVVGGAMGVCTFLVTLTFLSGVAVWQAGYGAPFIGPTAQFLFKDAVLLAGSYVLAATSARAIGRERAA